MAEETNYKEAGEQPPSTVEQQAPSVAEENAPSTNSEQATEIPTANALDPAAAKTAEKPEETADGESEPAQPVAKKSPPAKAADDKAAAAKAKGDKPAAAKKEKPPAVEDKPFTEFIEQDYLPALQKALAEQGLQGIDLTLKKQKLPVVGYERDECWQIVGRWQNGSRQFNLYFSDEDISGAKFFSCNEGSRPSTLEHFLGDERKMTLSLMVYGIMQRLNGQKWLALN